MANEQWEFVHLKWQKNAFRVVERTESSLSMVVENLSVKEERPRLVRLRFDNPTFEWAMLWDVKTEEWKEHPDKTNPIGVVITEAFAKRVGAKTKYSFGGNHKLGSSRWGFTADGCHIENET